MRQATNKTTTRTKTKQPDPALVALELHQALNRKFPDIAMLDNHGLASPVDLARASRKHELFTYSHPITPQELGWAQ